MPLDLVIGEVGRQKPEVHCPNEYVEWLHDSLRDTHTVTRANLKKYANEVMAKLCLFRMCACLMTYYCSVSGTSWV